MTAQKKSARQRISAGKRQVIKEGAALREVGSGSQSGEGAEFVNEVRLIVIATGDRGVRPIDRWFVSDPINGALKGTDSGKHFRPEANASIELAQKMPVTKANLIRDLPDTHRVAAALDNFQRVTDRAWWLGPSPHPFKQPRFHAVEARLVVKCFTEIIAQPIDVAAEDGVQFHDSPGKFAQRKANERPRATRAQTHSDEVHVTGFVDHDGRHAFAGNPAVPEGSEARVIVRMTKLLWVAEVDDQLHGAIRQDHIPPERRKPAASDPEMLDVTRKKRRDRADAVKEHGGDYTLWSGGPEAWRLKSRSASRSKGRPKINATTMRATAVPRTTQ